MVFLILFLVGFVGIGITLIVLDGFSSSRKAPATPFKWYDPPVESYISKGTKVLERKTRTGVRTLFHGGMAIHRTVTARIHVISWTKKKVRAYLYEHDREKNPLKISPFLRHVEKEKKKPGSAHDASDAPYTPNFFDEE